MRKNEMKTKILLITGLLLIFNLSLQAQGIPYNQEFQVNTFTQSMQFRPSTDSFEDSGFVVCWESQDQDGSGTSIFAQIFNSNGNKKLSEFKVNTFTDNDQTFPDVCVLKDGGFVICWCSEEQDGSRKGVFGQIFNGDGSLRGSEFQVNTFSDYDQWGPRISSLEDGGFVICWTNGIIVERDVFQDYDVFGQIFESNGNKRGAEFLINTFTAGTEGWPSAGRLEDGGFVVCWQGGDGSEYGTYGQLFNSDGSMRKDEFQVNTYTNDYQGDVKVSNTLSGGGFAVCWSSNCQDGSSFGIYGQLFENDGSRRGTEFQVNTSTFLQQEGTSISGLEDGRFVICWEDNSQYYNEGQWLISGQIFNSDGSKHGPEFRITENPYSLMPAVSSLKGGGFFICWDGLGSVSKDIIGKYYLKEFNYQFKQYSLIEPVNDVDVTLLKTNSIFKWSHANLEHINLPIDMEYQIYLDDSGDFDNPYIIPQIYDTTFTVENLTPGNTYF